MFGSKLLNSVLVAGLLAFSNAAHAAVYDFGSFLTGSSAYTGPTSTSFASLDANHIGNGTWDFELTINNTLFDTFGSGAFISFIKFDFNPDVTWNTLTSVWQPDSNGTTIATLTNGDSSGSVAVDFGTKFGTANANRLVEDEFVHWTVSGLGDRALDNMYVHVNAISGDACNGGSGCSAKFVPMTPVPEPETYAMLLAGLGLIGFSARRKA